MLPILYKRTKTGAIQQWKVIIVNDSYFTEYGQIDGEMQVTLPTFCEEKNLSRSNCTSAKEQAQKEAQALWDKKIKSGYAENIDDVDQEKFFEPQLCEHFEDHKHKLTYPVAVEDKLNGTRCIISKNGAFSRRGEQYFCVQHILEELKPLFVLYPDLILDGELFNYQLKNRLNIIASLVSVNRKAKDVTQEDEEKAREFVRFYIYDAINFENIVPDSELTIRKAALQKLVQNLEYSRYHKYSLAYSEEEINNLLEDVKRVEGEGLVIKTLDSPYINKRSKDWLKLKLFHSDEFEVLYFRMGTGNWAGKVKKIVCKLNKPATNGKTTFKTNIRGSREELKKLWEERDLFEFQGKKISVDFQGYSEYGIPLIPYCFPVFRDYE